MVSLSAFHCQKVSHHVQLAVCILKNWCITAKISCCCWHLALCWVHQSLIMGLFVMKRPIFKRATRFALLCFVILSVCLVAERILSSYHGHSWFSQILKFILFWWSYQSSVCNFFHCWFVSRIITWILHMSSAIWLSLCLFLISSGWTTNIFFLSADSKQSVVSDKATSGVYHAYTATSPPPTEVTSVVPANVNGKGDTNLPYCYMAQAQLSFHGHKDAVKFFVAVPGF